MTIVRTVVTMVTKSRRLEEDRDVIIQNIRIILDSLDETEELEVEERRCSGELDIAAKHLWSVWPGNNGTGDQ